jgi:hypothetical protein
MGHDQYDHRFGTAGIDGNAMNNRNTQAVKGKCTWNWL